MANLLFLEATFCTLSLFILNSLQFDLTILHTNDVHARFEQFDKRNVECDAEDAQEGKCFGGVARRATVIKQVRDEVDNVLLLDGGDQFQGTLWFYVHRGKAAAYFTNLLGYDVMTLGNHEFDLGTKELAEFLKLVNFDVVCANIDASNEPINGLFTKSTIKVVDGKQIGIVGYLYERTPELSETGSVVFNDILEAVQREVDILQAQGVDHIIALGHAGIDVDQEIAANVPGVDIVVGGHTDTFLYTGPPPSTEEPYDAYPIVVNPVHDPSAKVLVVQDYTFGKYLGRLDVEFDDQGNVVSFAGNPILLDSSIEEDPEVLADVAQWGQTVRNYSSTVIGKAHVFLDGTRASCRVKECNLGNLVADAFLASLITYPEEEKWNEVAIAAIPGGTMRTSIEQGDITVGDVASVVPFGNTVDYVELQGRYVKEMLEAGVARYDPEELPGTLLQTSGMLVTYDISREPGDRVVEVLVRCTECRVPDYFPLDDDKFYKIVTTSFIASGGDGFDVVREQAREHYTGSLDSAVLSNYISRHSPIVAGIERRLTIRDGSEEQRPDCTCPKSRKYYGLNYSKSRKVR